MKYLIILSIPLIFYEIGTVAIYKPKYTLLESIDSVSVTLKDKYDDGVLLGYEDVFGDHYDILEGTTFVPKHQVIRDCNVFHNLYFFIPNEVKNIVFKKDVSGFYFVETTNENLNKEANFDVFFRKDIFPLYTVADFMEYILVAKPIFATNTKLRDDMIDNYFNKKEAFLHEYFTKNKLSDEFLNTWRTAIMYEKISRNLSFGYKNKPNLAYLEKIKSKSLPFLQSDSLLDLPQFRNCCYSIVRLLEYLKFKKLNTSILEKEKIIEDNFSGKIKDYLIFMLLNDSFEVKKNDENSTSPFNIILQKYLVTATSPELVNYLKKRINISTISVNETDVLDLKSSKHNFNKILQNNVTYVDFWASWCAPCRAEMPDSKKLSEEYVKKGINFVYVSIDENAAAWEKASKQIGLPDVNSYILPNSKKSAIAKQFNISTIPRYILISKDGKVINADAPRPSDPKIRKVFDELLKN